MTEVVGLMDEETKELWDNMSLAYTESQGLPLLRREIASSINEGAAGEHVVDPDSVVVVVPEEGIFITMQALCEPGDHVVCVSPSYQSLKQIAQTIGCEVTAWEASWQHSQSGSAEADAPHLAFSIADLRKLMRPTTKMVVVNFPHNPTGWLPPRDMFEDIIKIAAEAGARVC